MAQRANVRQSVLLEPAASCALLLLSAWGCRCTSRSVVRCLNSCAGAALRRFRVRGGFPPLRGFGEALRGSPSDFLALPAFRRCCEVISSALLPACWCFLLFLFSRATKILSGQLFFIFARDGILLGLLLIFGGFGRGYPVMGCPPCGAAAGPSGRHGVFLVFAKSRWIVLVDTPKNSANWCFV